MSPTNFLISKKILGSLILTIFVIAAFFILKVFVSNLSESLAKNELAPTELKEALYWQDAGQGKNYLPKGLCASNLIKTKYLGYFILLI